MLKKIIALTGIIIFLSALGIRLYFSGNEKKAISLDDKNTIFAIIGEDSPPICTWEVKQPNRVMAENKSQAISIKTSNSADKQCETYLSLRAPGFDMSPAKEEQKIILPPNGKGSISWIITPRKTGTFAVTVSDVVNTKIFGISVTNVFGFTATQAKVFSIIGSLFGPIFTIPWWLEKWLARKKKQSNVSP